MARSTVKFEDFDPNRPSTSTSLFGVWADDHAFKVYTALSPAMGRWRAHSRAKLFEWSPSAGTWILRGCKDHNHKPTVCDECHQPTEEPRTRYDYRTQQTTVVHGQYDNMGSYVWLRHGTKLIHPLQLMFLCRACAARRFP